VLFYVLFLTIVLFYVLFVCKCVLYYCHRVATKLQLNITCHIRKTFKSILFFYSLFIYLLTHLLTYLFTYLLTYLFTYLLIYLFIYLFKVRTILDPMCCCVRSGDTLSYYKLHEAVASGVADTQSARR